MAELKTQKTAASVEAFLNTIPDEGKRTDAFAILELMRNAAGAAPKMWGSAIVGFGDRHYKYASGREGDWFVIGFSPRKQALTLYLSCSDPHSHALLEKLGKHKTGKGCLYLNRLSDVDSAVLQELIAWSVQKHQS